jgi:hypothetical protein
LNAAVLADRRLLDRIHLALEPGEFGGGLLVAADKEQRRPEDDDPTVVAIASFVRCLSCAPAAIAVTAKSRLAQAPKILTVDEAGLPGDTRAPAPKNFLRANSAKIPSLRERSWYPQRSMRIHWHVFSLGPAWMGVKSTGAVVRSSSGVRCAIVAVSHADNQRSNGVRRRVIGTRRLALQARASPSTNGVRSFANRERNRSEQASET